MALVDILLYEGVDELDFAAPFEVLCSCRRLVEGRWSDRPAFKVETVAEYRSPVRCANGLCIIPDRTFDMATEADIVIVPGGPGAQRDPLPPKIVEFLQIAHDSADVIASVCTGIFIVAKCGLADHHQVTTHQSRLADLHQQHPKAIVVSGQRVVTDTRGHLMSTGGISCGIDLALLIIQRFEGRDTAAIAAKRLEWPAPTAA
jgi:transcriptional regulator GlxA family with amidase domain